jgi:hypothetical protein
MENCGGDPLSTDRQVTRLVGRRALSIPTPARVPVPI